MHLANATPTILVTRPEPAGGVLCEKIVDAGWQAILFPTISFAPPNDPAAVQQIITHIDQHDWLIYISPQAVAATTTQLQQCWPQFPAHVQIAAVGAGTATALQAAHFANVIYPPTQWNSEGLLALPDFQHIAGKKIVLVRGEDGREVLADTLQARGASVTPLIAYRRVLPTTPVESTLASLRQDAIDLIVCTSGDSLLNLMTLLSAERQRLLATPVLVISERMHEQAQQLGFEQILVAKNASHDAIMASLHHEFAPLSQQGIRMEHQTESDNVVTPASGLRTAWGSVGILITAFSFIVLIAAFYFSYHALMANDNKLAAAATAMATQIDANQSKINALSQALSNAESDAKAVQATLATQQDALKQIHNTDQVKDALSVGEAQYLATLAQDNLQIGNNVPLVINLLQTADQKLRDLTDPKLLPIRKAFAADIAALQAVPAVDVTGIYLKLSALNTQIDKLPLPTLRPAEDNTQAVAEGKRLVWWKRGLQNSWDVIRKMVVIRYNKAGQIPFITPEQQQYLYQNLHAMLEQAMTAAVHKQPEIYQASLAQAANWVRQYFMSDAAATQAMLTSITELQAQNIKPALPNIDASLQALREFITASAQMDKTSTTMNQQ